MLAALVTSAVVLSSLPRVVHQEDAFGLGWLYGARGVVQPPEGAAIIAIDEDSASWLQRNSQRLSDVAPDLNACLGEDATARIAAMRSASEIPRDVFACLVDALASSGPRLLVLDVYFTVAQPEDRLLAASIARAGNVLLLERVSERSPRGVGEPSLLLRHRPVDALARAAAGTVGFLVESKPGTVTLRYVTHIDAFPDLRVMPVEAYRRVAGTLPPLAERDAFWLYGPPRTVPTWTIREVFEPSPSRPLALRDRVLFIGGAGTGPEEQRDSFAVPAFSGRLSGVELAATAYLNLSEGRSLEAPGPLGRAALAGSVVLGLAGSALFLPQRLAIGGALLLAAAVLVAAVALFHTGVWLPVAMPLLLGLASAGILGLERRLRFARGLATALLPRPISVRMLHSGSAPPSTQVASVLFADLARSTGLAESHGPEAYARIMARYYDLVTDAVDRHGGAVYKYEGDGVLALFSDATKERDARGALDAATSIASTAESAMAANGLPEVGIRIGISTGPVAIGMIRFGRHASIATMGDAVHRAYRLQEVIRELGQEGPGVVTLVDDATVAVVGPDAARMRFLTTVTLRGRSTATGVYRLVR